ncbi:MAG: hypothetical protein WCH37_04830, partial [Synechococcaceae cyanobacterium ELA182]
APWWTGQTEWTSFLTVGGVWHWPQLRNRSEMNPAWFRANSNHGTDLTGPVQTNSHAAKIQGGWDKTKAAIRRS